MSKYSAKQRDDLMYEFNTLGSLYNRKINDELVRAFMRAFDTEKIEHVLEAMREYPKSGRYFPTPAQIIEIIRERHRPSARESQGPITTSCNPRIAKAWAQYIRKTHGLEMPGERNGDLGWDEVLTIVNQQSAKHRNPEAILDEHKLPEYWGAV